MGYDYEPAHLSPRSVDAILADPLGCADLPDGAIPVHVVILVEYVEPGSDNRPGAGRLAVLSDELASPWGTIGMLRFAEAMELDDVGKGDEEDGDDG